MNPDPSIFAQLLSDVDELSDLEDSIGPLVTVEGDESGITYIVYSTDGAEQ